MTQLIDGKRCWTSPTGLAQGLPAATKFVTCEDRIDYKAPENASAGELAAGCNVLFKSLRAQANGEAELS